MNWICSSTGRTVAATAAAEKREKQERIQIFVKLEAPQLEAAQTMIN